MMTDANPSSSLTVLVVDDAATNRNLMAAFLARLGHEVIFAVDGVDALECFAAQRPDMVLMDLMMPRMDGFEATRQLRSRQDMAWAPIIIMSALNTDADIVAGLDAGADDYLVKPVSFAVFAAKMRTMARLLGMERRQRELLERMQAISNGVIDGLVTFDERGIIRSANPAASRMFACADGGLNGLRVTELVAPRGERPPYRLLARDLAGSPVGADGVVHQLDGQRADGTVFPLEVGVTELHLDGQPLYIGVLRDISERISQQAAMADHAYRLQRYHDEQHREQELARQIMGSQIDAEALRDPRIHFTVMPARRFSGDLVVAARSPSGRLFAMLADATGHGLTAAISVQPVLPVFYTLVARDEPLAQLVGDLNAVLHRSLPVGRFVGAALVCLSGDGREAEIWVGGVPEVAVIGTDGRVRQRFPSDHVPLGVVNTAAEGCQVARCAVLPGEQLVMYSDGVVEATNDEADSFGVARLEQLLAAHPADGRIEALRIALAEHLAGASAHDDMSALLLDCAPSSDFFGLWDAMI
ncbi:SpoIIE family protein phosphatase [Denitromonas iodatirespirans]|uniref:SpoIIE family protein phosphatase n=1 Tax=Denitromonas iodatirespirans TaxID=2795389 RepID=A0A944DAK5_DENI1|nr:SpoIIE family protein phosphatase [Denitromonas iodatirespirans]MBT0960917.1 SpoIIE family protein phosphatase [Denitromonas iodatirespirans]